MPKSRGRSKKTKSRYELRPATKKRAKKSPRWYGPAVLGVMGAGVLVIVLNYMGLIPGTNGTFSSTYLLVGGALIALGFVGTTFWR
jgi:Cell division protein CrgA